MKLEVDLGTRGYDIIVESGLLGQSPITRINSAYSPSRVFVITDANVAPHYSCCFEGLDSIVLPAGEATKNFKNFESLSEELLRRGVDRQTVLIALGGGVIGDLTGFVAATLLRGIRYVQVPTTLLAQVDSSVGGKTAIDAAAGKNLVGAFHQPSMVLIDPLVLKTLPERHMRAGYAEIVKYGLIQDRSFFEWLRVNGSAVIDGGLYEQQHAILESCRAKARIVALDEREHGIRAHLNLGHTFAHAIEALNNFDDSILHGEAVAAGMCLAFRLSSRLGRCGIHDVEAVEKHLKVRGLPTRLSDFSHLPAAAEAYLEPMAKDKKALANRLVFILPEEIGQAFVARDVPAEAVKEIIAESLCAA